MMKMNKRGQMNHMHMLQVPALSVLIHLEEYPDSVRMALKDPKKADYAHVMIIFR